MYQNHIFKILIVLIVSINFIYNYTSQTRASENPKIGSIIINEINWMGSSSGDKSDSTDEWIELYNTTNYSISLQGYELWNNSNSIPLDGVINAKGYYVLTRLSKETTVVTQANKYSTGTKLSISNSAFVLKIVSQGIVIDEVSTGGTSPFAGVNDSNGDKRTMARILPELTGNSPQSWKSSLKKKNIKQGKDYCKNIATPGSENFTSSDTTKYEIEELCFENVVLKSDLQSVEINQPGQKVITSFIHEFENAAPKYEIDLTGNNLKNISIHLDTNNEQEISFDSKYLLSDQIRIQFIKPEVLKKVSISIISNLEQGEFSSLDALVVTKSSLHLTNSYILQGKDLLPENNNSHFLNKNNTSAYFHSISEINPSSTKTYKAIYTINAAKLPESEYLEQVALIKVFNPWTNALFTKKVFNSELSENVSKEVSILFSSEIYGSSTHSIEINSEFVELVVDAIKVEEVQNEKIEFNTIDLLDTEVLIRKNDTQNNTLLIRKEVVEAGKIISSPFFRTCNKDKTCRFSITLKNINPHTSTSNYKLVDFYAQTIEDSGSKNQRVLQVNGQDLKDEREYTFSIDILSEDISRAALGVIYYGNHDLEVSNISITNIIDTNIPPNLKSVSSINWKEKQQLKNNNINGLNSSFIDVIQPYNSLEAGDYTFALKAKKHGRNASSNDILNIAAFDQTGKQLFDRAIEENDLSVFNEIEFKNSFSFVDKSNIKIVVQYFGKSKGADSNLEVSMDLKKI